MAINTLESIDNEQALWANNFLESLLKDQELDENLKKTLLNIGEKAYFTTFIGDYDSQPDGIGLSTLSQFPKQAVKKCLDYFFSHGNPYIREYVSEYKACNHLN